MEKLVFKGIESIVISENIVYYIYDVRKLDITLAGKKLRDKSVVYLYTADEGDVQINIIGSNKSIDTSSMTNGKCYKLIVNATSDIDFEELNEANEGGGSGGTVSESTNIKTVKTIEELTEFSSKYTSGEYPIPFIWLGEDTDTSEQSFSIALSDPKLRKGGLYYINQQSSTPNSTYLGMSIRVVDKLPTPSEDTVGRMFMNGDGELYKYFEKEDDYDTEYYNEFLGATVHKTTFFNLCETYQSLINKGLIGDYILVTDYQTLMNVPNKIKVEWYHPDSKLYIKVEPFYMGYQSNGNNQFTGYLLNRSTSNSAKIKYALNADFEQCVPFSFLIGSNTFYRYYQDYDTSRRASEFDTIIDDVKYECYYEAKNGIDGLLYIVYWIPENIVDGQNITYYMQSKYEWEVDNFIPDFSQATQQSGVITLENYESRNFKGVIIRAVDFKGNSFPFDFFNTELSDNNGVSWHKVFPEIYNYDGSINDVVWEGDNIDLSFQIVAYHNKKVSNIIVKKGCENIHMPQIDDDMSNITFDANVKNITLDVTSVGALQNIHVTSGDYKDGNDDPQIVTIARSNNFETTVGLNSQGVIKQGNLMDLIP